MNQRNRVLQAHSWTGIALGILLVYVALTGALLAFRAELESAESRVRPALAASSAALSPGRLMARAMELHASVPPTLIQYGAGVEAPATVRFSDGDVISLDPVTGDLLRRNSWFASAAVTFIRLHTFAFWKRGAVVAASIAVVVGALAITGLWLCWPQSMRALRGLLKFNRALKGRLWNLNMHRTLGFYVSAFLLVSAGTGLPVAATWARELLYLGTGSAVERLPPHASAESAATLSVDQLAQIAARLVPGPQYTTIRYRAGNLVECYMVARDAPHPNARTLLLLDGATGEVLSFVPYAQSSAGYRLYFWLFSIHTGQVGGIWGQLGLLSGALGIPILAYTGIAAFWQRKQMAKRPRPV